MKLRIIVGITLFLARWATTPQLLLFYDAPEYLRIALEHPLGEAIRLGHPPVKPVVTAFLWGSTRILSAVLHTSAENSANLSILIIGMVSVFLFLVLAKQLLPGRRNYQAALLFSVFPSVWIVSTNLLAESILLPLYLATLVFTLRYLRTPTKIHVVAVILLISLLIGGHIQMAVWLPTVFVLALVARPKQSLNMLLSLASLVFLGLIVALIGYAVIFSGGERSIPAEMQYQFFGRAADHYFLADPVRGLSLGIRNFLFTMRGAFGTGTLVALIGAGWINRKKKGLLIALSLLSISLVISGSVWTGDFMMRRVVFAAPLFSLILVKTFPRASWLVLVLIVPITVANGVLSLRWKSADMVIPQIAQAQSLLPTNQVLIATRYLTPFTYPYQGTILFAGRDDLSTVALFLKEGKRVFLDSTAVTAPYLLPVGNNLHGTSVKTGRSETQALFEQYAMDIVLIHDPNRFLFFYELHVPNDTRPDAAASTMIRADPGTIVSVRPSQPLQKLHRARTDYADICSWLIGLATASSDPLFFTYADTRGRAMIPVTDTAYILQRIER